MKLLAFLLPVLILFAACGEVSPTGNINIPSASVTPDIYTLALGNVQAQKTLEAMQATSVVASAKLTATAVYPTQAAQQTATERAWIMTGWTATAAIKQSATADSGTATQQVLKSVSTQQAINLDATIESASASAKATELHAQSVSVELALERERMMNKVQAISPWFVFFLIMTFSLVLILRRSRVRSIQRDARGDAPLLVINESVYDADRNPTSVLDFSGKRPTIPALTNPVIQAATTERDQMIDLATRASLGGVSLQHQPLLPQSLSPKAVTIQIISPAQARPLLGNAINGIVRDAIDADIDSDEKEEQHD